MDTSQEEAINILIDKKLNAFKQEIEAQIESLKQDLKQKADAKPVAELQDRMEIVDERT